jgi:CRP/FNR family transcriptional regulator
MHVQPIKRNGKTGVTPSAVTSPARLRCRRCASRSLGVCAPLGNKALAMLVAMGEQRRWGKGQLLYHCDDPAEAYYKITKGIITESAMMADGRRQIVGILTVGDLCGYPARKGRYGLTGQAITPVEACAFDARKFTAYMQRNVQLAYAVANALAERVRRDTVGRTVLGQLQSVERVAHFILEMQERLPFRGTYTGQVALHLKREEIADYLGLTLETVSRVFRKLKDMRIIASVSAGVVAVLDRQRLSEIGLYDPPPTTVAA